MAKEVSTDSTDGTNSIIKIIDNISAAVSTSAVMNGESTLVIPLSLAVASSWILGTPLIGASALKITVGIYDPSGTEVVKQEHSATFNTGTKRVNFNLVMQGLPISRKSGTYNLKAKLSQNDTVIGSAEYPFEVNVDVKEA
ncbi:MAG: hypothetical protein WDN66_02605 [Candidatus Saccharibacteria bacterium]